MMNADRKAQVAAISREASRIRPSDLVRAIEVQSLVDERGLSKGDITFLDACISLGRKPEMLRYHKARDIAAMMPGMVGTRPSFNLGVAIIEFFRETAALQAVREDQP